MFSEQEQDEIINEFLKVIEMNDIKINKTSKVGTCAKCKFNKSNLDMYKLFPAVVAKSICKYNFEECDKCFLLRHATKMLQNKGLHSIVRKSIYDKYKITIDEDSFINDPDENLKIFYFIKLNSFQHTRKYKA